MFQKQFYFEVSPAWADTLYAVAQSLSKLFKPDFNICGKESSIFWLKLTFSTWGGWQQKVLNQLPLVRTKAINHFYIHNLYSRLNVVISLSSQLGSRIVGALIGKVGNCIYLSQSTFLIKDVILTKNAFTRWDSYFMDSSHHNLYWTDVRCIYT